ncbi:MAG TPA: hypothetical protein VIU61_01760 [Kofleriaceae bacterium]
MGTTSRDSRWFAFGLLVLGMVVAIYGGLANWLAYADSAHGPRATSIA